MTNEYEEQRMNGLEIRVSVGLDKSVPLEKRVSFEHEPLYIRENPAAPVLFSSGAERVVIPNGYPSFNSRHVYLKIEDVAHTIMGSGEPVRQLLYRFEGVSDKY